jgi:hydroxymethylpyrimidine pyrophosphatase-like HAD family hydrolase
MSIPRYLDASPDLLDALSRVEILYTDLDGTLLAPGGTLLADGDGAPSATCAEAVVAANRAAVTIVPVSGRSRFQLMEVARLCGWNDFIAEAGAIRTYWRDGVRELHYDVESWPEDLPAHGRTPLEEMRATGVYHALVSAFPGQLEHHDPWHENREATDVLRGCVDVRQAQEVLDRFDLPMEIADNGLVRRRSTSLACDGMLHAYHIVPRGVSKRRAVELDLEERGLSAEKAAFIGDSPADLQAAPQVAVAVLVGNALEQAGLEQGLAEHPNAALVHGRRGDGWAEFAHAWLRARQG